MYIMNIEQPVPFDPREHQIDALMDGGGYSRYMAERMVDGESDFTDQKTQRSIAKVALDGADEHAAVEEAEGRVVCANCNRPGCPGCGRS